MEGYEPPLVAMSGNGYHIMQRVNLDMNDTLPSRLEAYFHEAPIEGDEDTEDLDSIFDPPRIIKVPGTMSVKGVPTEERPHRLSFILTEGSATPDEELGKHITQLLPYEAPLIDTTTKKKRKRRVSSIKPCYKLFAEEGGRLSATGSETRLLMLALVTEAHSKGYSRDQIVELFSHNENFDPEKTRKEVDHQLGKMAVEGIKPWSCLAIYKHGGCLGESCSKFKGQVARYRPLEPPVPGQPANPDSFFDGADKFVPSFLVDYIIESAGEGHIKTPRTKKGGDLTWWYNPETGIFKDNGVSFLHEKIIHLLGDKVRNHMIIEVVSLIQKKTYINRQDFEEAADILVLQNGVYHLDTEELTEYGPQYNATSRWPMAYDPDATCPAVLKFLEQVIPGRVQDFLEWLGYHFIKDYRFNVILMLIGDGENGKSVLLNLLRTFLGGINNVSNVKLYDLVTDKFAASRLYGKVANIYPDIDQHELKYTGLLKALTGNDWFGVQEKHFQGFDMRNRAKLSFSTNKMPKTPDSSRAFHRRWFVVNCPNFFVKDATPEQEADGIFPRDPNIIAKITTPQELSGLFNEALKGRRRLLENGGFSLASVDERQKHYEEMMDPVAAYITNCVTTLDPTGVIPQDDFFRFYFQFCKVRGFTPVLRQTFTKQIKPRIVALKEARLTFGEGRRPCWIGISMAPDKAKAPCEKCAAYPACISTKRMKRDGVSPKVQYKALVAADIAREIREKNAPPPPDTSELTEHVLIERQLVTTNTLDAAILILSENDNKMPQQLLRRKLEYYGHDWNEANRVLRGDPRLRFEAMFVTLKKEESA